jgi:hypothetical protein
MRVRSYHELRRIETFEDRFAYLDLGGQVGETTFGSDRWFNQRFYRSREWRHVRDIVIIRDGGCDLGVPGYEIHGRVMIHHMNPIAMEDLTHGTAFALDPEYLITTTHRTHNAIHYGSDSLLPKPVVERKAGDTKLW